MAKAESQGGRGGLVIVEEIRHGGPNSPELGPTLKRSNSKPMSYYSNVLTKSKGETPFFQLLYA